jgi:hypothetical protein
MNDPKTRLALLGTMSDIHKQPISYDLACLQKIVIETAPDLLCAEVTRGAWEQGDISQSSVEVREALAPIIAVTDIVLIPVAPTAKQFPDFAPRFGWRHRLAQIFDQLLRWAKCKRMVLIQLMDTGSALSVTRFVWQPSCFGVQSSVPPGKNKILSLWKILCMLSSATPGAVCL